ncbi:hypothetical protein Rhopal_003188-T1 [Rhodotorula paludigena]|uniref:Uncharacterized protein n=1 Tax=Rhodotorula paludigena TaxID=86838 RepID=A0AAV5GIA7_9BASI|nr:hypothetical protein Rhopal_003188-T1 [Rhodotorula paludigena]
MPRKSLDRRHFTREEVFTALSNIFRRYPFSKPRAVAAAATLEGIKIEFAEQKLEAQRALLEWFARLDEWSDPREVGRPHQTPKIPSPWSEDTQASQQLEAIAEQVKDL